MAKKIRKQCAKCPWKVSTNPRDIPGGYCEVKHAGLENTIADPGSCANMGGVRIMACHETTAGKELPCIGWMDNQLGEGNNMGLRMAVITGRIDGNFETVGEQHECLEDTLPQD